ncbi:MAG: glycoside hydrolase family 97 N-terminal domain-containing protein, partial [Candidatus Thermoplasmatota archaeon]|nr:glycoside hydrolase family 97 N-terminal domain-containing protein [Candidatus Thermoplasmatota archaeon]
MATTEREPRKYCIDRDLIFPPPFMVLFLTFLFFIGSLNIASSMMSVSDHGIGSMQQGAVTDRTGGYSILSPNSKLELGIYLGDVGSEKSCLLYDLTIDDMPIITCSRLGLVFGNGVGTFGSSLSIVKMTKTSVNSTYTMTFAERDRYPDRYNSMTLLINEPPPSGRSISLETRAYDEGVAFRYVSGSTGWPSSILITGELTGFNFKSDHYCYTEYGTEGSYTNESVRQVSSKCESPLTVELNEGKHVS